MIKKILILLLLTSTIKVVAQEPFVHPGILHSQESLDRMKKLVKQEKQPNLMAFEELSSNKLAEVDYIVRGGYDSVAREKDKNLYLAQINADCAAAYYNALMYSITGDKAHAKKTVKILNAWSYKLKAIVRKDKELLAGLDGDLFVNAAEIIRYTYPDWDPKDIKQCEKMFLEVFYPVVKTYAEWANGNWGNSCLKTAMGIGVFCNNREIFNDAVAYYLKGKGNGSLPNYVFLSGQCQESGRDQAHTQLGLGNLAECAEIAFNQGFDLYGALDNRLLKGFEYTAKYNLGEEVSFVPTWDVNHKYYFKKISEENRADWRPIYEMVYNHYVNRKRLMAPNIKKVIEKNRPETAGPRPVDQPGYGTLSFAIPEPK